MSLRTRPQTRWKASWPLTAAGNCTLLMLLGAILVVVALR